MGASLAQSVGPEGKRVNILAPGYVDTDILAGDSPEKRQQREQEVPPPARGSPDDMAATVSFLVGPDSAYITGAILHVNGDFISPDSDVHAGESMVNDWDDDGSFEALADQPLLEVDLTQRNPFDLSKALEGAALRPQSHRETVSIACEFSPAGDQPKAIEN